MSRKRKNYGKIIYPIMIVVLLILISVKSYQILSMLLASGIGITVGERIISYAKNYLKERNYRKKDSKDRKGQSEKNLEVLVSKQNIKTDEYVPFKEEQLENLKQDLPEIQFDLNSFNTIIRIIEKKIATNHDPRELNILKKQLTQYQFQLYDFIMEHNCKDAFNPVACSTTTKNNGTNGYTKHLSYKSSREK